MNPAGNYINGSGRNLGHNHYISQYDSGYNDDNFAQ